MWTTGLLFWAGLEALHPKLYIPSHYSGTFSQYGKIDFDILSADTRPSQETTALGSKSLLSYWLIKTTNNKPEFSILKCSINTAKHSFSKKCYRSSLTNVPETQQKQLKSQNPSLVWEWTKHLMKTECFCQAPQNQDLVMKTQTWTHC